MRYCVSVDAYAYIEMTVDTAMLAVFIYNRTVIASNLERYEVRGRPISILHYQGLSI